MHKIPLLLRFKIDSKVFSFKPNFINKSCRAWILVSNKTSLTILGFFYTFLWILQVDWIVFKEGCYFLTNRPLETFKTLQSSPWPATQEVRPMADQIPARWLAGGEGHVGENDQWLTAVTGVVGCNTLMQNSRIYNGINLAPLIF
jgi:hypothetical protein